MPGLGRTFAAVLAIAAAVAGCTTPYQPRGALGGFEDEAIGGDKYHISIDGNGYTRPGTLEAYFFRRAQDIVKEHGYTGYRLIALNSGYARGPTGRRPYATGIIEGVKGGAPGASGGAPSEAAHSGGATGSGFAVSADGILLTDAHVVKDCRQITVQPLDGVPISASLLASDAVNDLALLKAASPLEAVVQFRDGAEILQGDSVVAVGFPLSGILSSGTTLTTGTVSALAGIDNDSRLLQVSVPIQPGNSGGPILDQSGNVVGLAESSLNWRFAAAVTGSLPDNVNFATKASVARTFMDSHAIAYRRAPSVKTLSNAEIGAQARKYTALIRCME